MVSVNYVTFGSIFLAVVVVVDPLLAVLLAAVRDADNCLFTVSLSCFSVSGPPFVIVFVRGCLALSGAVVGRGFVGDRVLLIPGADEDGLGAADVYDIMKSSTLKKCSLIQLLLIIKCI